MTVVVVEGPSGAGKSHLIRALCRDPEFRHVPSVTTRSPRRGEVQGRDKEFVSRLEFSERAAKGELICVSSNYGEWYAHSRTAIAAASTVAVVELARSSAPEFAGAYPGTLFLRVQPVEPAVAAGAVAARGCDGTDIAARLAEISSDPDTGQVAWTVVANSYDESSEEAFIAAIRAALGRA